MAEEKKNIPKLRFREFAGDNANAWELRKLGDEFKKVNERNNGKFDKSRWISVAKMYFQNPDKVQSNNIEYRGCAGRLRRTGKHPGPRRSQHTDSRTGHAPG